MLVKVKEEKGVSFQTSLLSVTAWNRACFRLMIIFYSYNFLVVLLLILKLLNRITFKILQGLGINYFHLYPFFFVKNYGILIDIN